MSDQSQRSEKATPRRITKARRDGNFVTSAELLYAVGFTVGIYFLGGWGAWWWKRLEAETARWLHSAFVLDREMASVLVEGRDRFAGLILPVLAVMCSIVVCVILTQMAVTGLGWAPSKLTPDLTRLNPIQRLKQLPAQNGYQLIRAIILLPFVIVLLGVFVNGIWEEIIVLPMRGLAGAVALITEWSRWLLWRGAVVLMALGILDWIRQRRRYFVQLRMSKQEIREEMKEMEGSSLVKARIRRMQRELARRRSIQDVSTASVLVVNPTHYAVAIRYVQSEMAAPKVVAKGKNAVAAKIRTIAVESEVPIVENPPLAQALYKSAEVGSEIPPAFYRAVAEVLAYIFRVTRGRMRHGFA